MSAPPVIPALAQRLAMIERPATPIVGRQRWSDLLFLHWKVEASAVQATLPPGLFVDAFEGAAYLGIVPFFMERVRPAWLPPLPWVSWFLELNVRTYVHDREGWPGVWFYSLDCNQPLAVAIARRFFHLRYFHAKMRATRRAGVVEYQSQRRGTPAVTSYAWQPDDDTREAAPGSLEFYLVERYAHFFHRPERCPTLRTGASPALSNLARCGSGVFRRASAAGGIRARRSTDLRSVYERGGCFISALEKV